MCPGPTARRCRVRMPGAVTPLEAAVRRPAASRRR
jgi:hypothetical protein